MPNFARSDDVNLAYAQANTVVNLATSVDLDDRHQGERRPQLLARRQQRLRPDPDDLDQQLGRRHRGGLGHPVQLHAPPVQSVGQSLNFPAAGTDYQNTVYTLTSKYCVRCHSSTAAPRSNRRIFADPQIATAYPAAIPKIDFTGCIPFNADDLRHQLALLSAPADR